MAHFVFKCNKEDYLFLLTCAHPRLAVYDVVYITRTICVSIFVYVYTCTYTYVKMHTYADSRPCDATRSSRPFWRSSWGICAVKRRHTHFSNEHTSQRQVRTDECIFRHVCSVCMHAMEGWNTMLCVDKDETQSCVWCVHTQGWNRKLCVVCAHTRMKQKVVCGVCTHKDETQSCVWCVHTQGWNTKLCVVCAHTRMKHKVLYVKTCLQRVYACNGRMKHISFLFKKFTKDGPMCMSACVDISVCIQFHRYECMYTHLCKDNLSCMHTHTYICTHADMFAYIRCMHTCIRACG
jgi:hypothetical protein